jgi:RNA recognition motif-containing protein
MANILPPHLVLLQSTYKNKNNQINTNIENKQINIEKELIKSKQKKEEIKSKPKTIRQIKVKEYKNKKWKVLRKSAGEIWEDPTLNQWESNDYRIYVKNLGNEVTDDILTTAFKKYPSFHRAKVIRDKKTNKTRGFGFVSIGKETDYINAMREMNGKYVGNRPLCLERSKWKERSIINNKSSLDNFTFKKASKRIRKKDIISPNDIEPGQLFVKNNI